MKNLPSITVLILLAIASYKYLFPKECIGLADGLWALVFVCLLLIFMLTTFLISLHKKLCRGKTINLKPYFTFVIGLLAISLGFLLKSELFKSKRLYTATSKIFELILRENKSYEHVTKLPEYSCTEKGNYQISNDTLYLYQSSDTNEVFIVDYQKMTLTPIIGNVLDQSKTYVFK